jgi:Fe-S-cluster containining protein
MGQSIRIDPYDVYQLTKNLGQSFTELLAGPIELHMEDGLILPNLRMTAGIQQAAAHTTNPVYTSAVAQQTDAHQLPSCAFLNEQGRCSIHAFRPGICRLFPLGRNYTPEHLNYFLLVHECPAKNKTKMKVSKWLDCDRLRDYQQFLIDWHNLTKQVRAQVAEHLDDAEESRRITMQFLNLFFVTPYTGEDFYPQFYERLKEA